MVMLSELRTADELVLALVQQGWTKHERPDGFCGFEPAGPFFTFWDSANEPGWIDQRIRTFSLYPQVLDHCDDMSIGCNVDELNRLFNWQMVEHHAGQAVDIDPATVELDRQSIGQLLYVWQCSWQATSVLGNR